MDEVWPEAQANIAAELGTGMPDAVVFAPNTHDFIIRLVAAAPRSGPAVRILTTDGEFHSARRQFARWEESGEAVIDRVPCEPFETLSDRFLESAQQGGHDLIFISQALFGSGRRFDRVDQLASLARPEGSWVVIDGYHAFMAIEAPFDEVAAESAFYLGGGYKYAMSGRVAPSSMRRRALAPVRQSPAGSRNSKTLPCRQDPSATARTRCGSWARHSILRDCTGSMPFAECWTRMG
ncbi:aminotransferase class V-fold PLP-dependent enzyme [Sphingomonas daechungensis]|uniref:hypothetical protein n=1 Tax=Sphingomonas daechungensis TaxID=1176646 RepID=UPI001CB9C682|nr:hypothetical protein [Sphingomonas daechungensis]